MTGMLANSATKRQSCAIRARASVYGTEGCWYDPIQDAFLNHADQIKRMVCTLLEILVVSK
jgi:hypothetical protein